MKAKLREYIEEKIDIHIPKNVKMSILTKVTIIKTSFGKEMLAIYYRNKKGKERIEYTKITNNNFYIVNNKYFIINIENEYYINNNRYLAAYSIQNKKTLENIKSCIANLLI